MKNKKDFYDTFNSRAGEFSLRQNFFLNILPSCCMFPQECLLIEKLALMEQFKSKKVVSLLLYSSSLSMISAIKVSEKKLKIVPSYEKF